MKNISKEIYFNQKFCMQLLFPPKLLKGGMLRLASKGAARRGGATEKF